MADASNQIKFEDGAGYERMMGVWSRKVGETFLDWLAPQRDARWIDVGCGNGAFTELLVERCSPLEVQGVDPSEQQLAFARGRPAARLAKFHTGDAQSLPFPGEHFDAAVMALVIFFVPDAPKGVSEMVRVVRPGGSVSAYAWDLMGGGFPLAPLLEAMTAIGIPPIYPPSAEASRMDNLRKLWTDAGLQDVETRRIDVQRTFRDFEEFWEISTLSASTKARFATLPADTIADLMQRVRAKLPAEADGSVVCSAWAHAVKGRVPD
jgi:SAM-dependent methyltransferase